MPRKKKTESPDDGVAVDAAVESPDVAVTDDASADMESPDVIAPSQDLAVEEADRETGAPEEGEADSDEEPLPAVPGDRAVTFRLEDQLYGMPIGVVQEIQQIAEFQPLPDDDPALVGLIDLRGTVVPVLDLRVLVGLTRRPYTLETPMIFCRSRDHIVCLVVETVEDVIDLASCTIQPPSALYSLADRMLGVCRLPQGLVLLLDIEKLVPGVALAIADEMGGGAA